MYRYLNYFILLQLFNYDYNKTSEVYQMYNQVIMNNEFEKVLDFFLLHDIKLNFEFTEEHRDKAISEMKNIRDNTKLIHYFDNEYPEILNSLKYKPICIFAKGNIDLLNKNYISILGTNKADEKTIQLSKELTSVLLEKGFNTISGLIPGVETSSQEVNITTKDEAVAIMGTNINDIYPKEKKLLYKYIYDTGLILTEFPTFCEHTPFNYIRRNYLLTALSTYTIIIHANDNSLSASSCRVALEHDKHVFVTKDCHNNKNNHWCNEYSKQFKNNYHVFKDINELLFIIEKLI